MHRALPSKGRPLVLATLAWVWLGCGAPAPSDAGSDTGDAGPDAGLRDAGPGDAGPGDAGGSDAGAEPDAGDPDAGTIGGGAATSAEIQAVLDAPDGPVDLVIHDTVVTYVAPPRGVFGPGFFVQAERAGPALYVDVDPADLFPRAAVGFVVDLRVLERATTTDGSGITYASSAAVVRVASSGHDVGFLAQEVTSVDLIAELDGHAMELVTLEGRLHGNASWCGPYFCFAITTAGVPDASPNLRLRAGAETIWDLGLLEGCDVRVGPSPLWRHGLEAQPTAWVTGDVVVRGCPAPPPEPDTGDVVITEVGLRFSGVDAEQQFVELTNRSPDRAFDLSRCAFVTGSSAVGLGPGVVLHPGERLILGAAGSEAGVDATFPGPGVTLIEDGRFELSCGIGSVPVLVDGVDWRVTGESRYVDDVTLQLDPAVLASSDPAAGNDVGSAWCLTPSATYGTGRRGTPGADNQPCPSRCGTVATRLVINEIDDGSGFGVETHELVELHNPTASALSLDGLAVVLFDGTTGREYERVSLFGSLAPGGYAAVTAPDPGTGFALSLPSGVPRFVFPGSGTIDRIRNSGTPNGAGLLDLASGMLVDFVTYEGTFASEALLDSVGAPLATIPLGRNDAIANDGWLPGMGARPSVPRSSSRATDGCDTGTPSADWVVTETTPGAPNVF